MRVKLKQVLWLGLSSADFCNFEPKESKINNQDISNVSLNQKYYARKLDLTGNSVKDDGVTCPAILENIEELDLYYNRVGPKRATALAQSNLKTFFAQEQCICGGSRVWIVREDDWWIHTKQNYR